MLLAGIVLAVFGGVIGLILGFASRFFHVAIDPKVTRVFELLPGINCGACGEAGCMAYATAVCSGSQPANLCVPGGRDAAVRISEFLGLEFHSREQRVAVVQCQGGIQASPRYAEYRGLQDCDACQLTAGGDKKCLYGCLGYGTCVAACAFNAIVMGPQGLPIVNNQCVGCGACVKACPRNILTLIPASQKVYVGCINRDAGKKVKDACTRGCTACGLCAHPKVTPSGCITIKKNLPVIDFAHPVCIVDEAVKKCPQHCFVVRE